VPQKNKNIGSGYGSENKKESIESLFPLFTEKKMKHQFKIVALPANLFQPYFEASNNELKRLHAYWIVVDQSPGYPCRVTLEDATVGERVLVCNFEHHPVNSAYQASGPIFVREKAINLMVEADLVKGENITQIIQSQLENSSVEYIHIHNAVPGCFSCAIERVVNKSG